MDQPRRPSACCWVVYPAIVALGVAIFLLNTHAVHRLPAAVKRQKLESVARHLARACNRLEESISKHRDTHGVATELNALATIKRELETITTWPYNMEMLRTLVISAAAPPVLTIQFTANIYSRKRRLQEGAHRHRGATRRLE